jgi:PAS domain S-box-containing protein
MFKLAAWLQRTTPSVRYAGALALALAAPATRLPLQHLHFKPLMPYSPFIVISAILLGLGPGLFTTLLCLLETIYFAVQPTGSVAAVAPENWERVAVVCFTGVFASIMAEQLRQSSGLLKKAHGKTKSILDSILDGFIAFDSQWRYTYVNPAAASMMGKTPEELIGQTLWEVWPHASGSEFGAVYRRAVAENVPLQMEGYYPEPLNAWFEVRCYPSPEGLSMFFTETTERRQRDEQLRFLESAALQTSDGILILKVPGNVAGVEDPVFVNPAFERMTGFNLEDLRRGALELLVNAAEARAGGAIFVERLTRRKDGSEFWAEFNFKLLEASGGDYTHGVWTLRDITERKDAREASRLLSSIVEESDDAIISKNLDGVVLTWNRGAERIYGYTAAEMVGQSISRLMPLELRNDFLEIMDDLRRGGRLQHYETQRLRKDGRRIAVSLTISPLKNAAGYVVGASIISRDVTERRLAEKALALSEERYRSLALATTQIVWSTSSNGEVTEDIPMWREFTGQSPDEVKGMGWIDALHPQDRERNTEVWLRAAGYRSFYHTEYRMRRYDGQYRWMAVHGVPVLDSGGGIREWVATCADIQDRKQAEDEISALNEDLEQRVVRRTKELQAANQELEAFAYSVSHDLRAPLRAVDGFSRILLEEYSPSLPEKARYYLTVARKNALQMGDLIDDLLAFSRLSRQPLSMQPVAPGDLVRQALDELRADQEGRRIQITVGDLPPCEGDPKLLKQVLINLLSNGFKYTRKQEIARIDVGALTPDGSHRPVYYVRDNGVGFDMRYADKLFGVFQRLHGGQEYPGTGVGLAIVQRIVQRHGGQVWADAAVNQGATFYFVLNQNQADPRGEEPEQCPTNQQTVK